LSPIKEATAGGRYGCGMANAGSATPGLSADLSVGGFLRACPAGAGVFLAHRMACVGCPLAEFETLADAAREYRLSLADFLAELAGVAAAPPPAATDSSGRK
jgi:hybrid cluster-associated redox disulfide protein